MTLVCREGWVQKVALASCPLHMTLMCREGWVQKVALASCTLHVAEIFSLLLLSLVPSIEDFALHKLSFGSFLLFSALYLAASYTLLRYRETLMEVPGDTNAQVVFAHKQWSFHEGGAHNKLCKDDFA